MIGLCHRCGYMGDSPAPKDQGPTKEEHEALHNKYMQELSFRIDADQNLGQVRRYLELAQQQLAERDNIVKKLDTMLEILMATSEAGRVSIVSKIKRRNKVSPILASIRKANANEST